MGGLLWSRPSAPPWVLVQGQQDGRGERLGGKEAAANGEKGIKEKGRGRKAWSPALTKYSTEGWCQEAATPQGQKQAVTHRIRP